MMQCHAADRLYVKYTDMRANYTGAHLDNSRKFDAELVKNVILRMNRGKAADLDGITVEHLCYSSGLPVVCFHAFCQSFLTYVCQLVTYTSEFWHVIYRSDFKR